MQQLKQDEKQASLTIHSFLHWWILFKRIGFYWNITRYLHDNLEVAICSFAICI